MAILRPGTLLFATLEGITYFAGCCVVEFVDAEAERCPAGSVPGVDGVGISSDQLNELIERSVGLHRIQNDGHGLRVPEISSRTSEATLSQSETALVEQCNCLLRKLSLLGVNGNLVCFE